MVWCGVVWVCIPSSCWLRFLEQQLLYLQPVLVFKLQLAAALAPLTHVTLPEVLPPADLNLIGLSVVWTVARVVLGGAMNSCRQDGWNASSHLLPSIYWELAASILQDK